MSLATLLGATVQTVDTVKAEPEAVCSECGWTREGATGSQWLAIRAAAQRHVAATGHTVLAGVRTSYLYAPAVRFGR